MAEGSVPGAANKIELVGHNDPAASPGVATVPVVHGLVAAMSPAPHAASPAFISPVLGAHVSIFAAAPDGTMSLAADPSNPGKGATTLFGQPDPAAGLGIGSGGTSLTASVNAAAAVAASSAVGAGYQGQDSVQPAAAGDLVPAKPDGATDPGVLPVGTHTIEQGGLSVTFRSAEDVAKSTIHPAPTNDK